MRWASSLNVYYLGSLFCEVTGQISCPMFKGFLKSCLICRPSIYILEMNSLSVLNIGPKLPISVCLEPWHYWEHYLALSLVVSKYLWWKRAHVSLFSFPQVMLEPQTLASRWLLILIFISLGLWNCWRVQVTTLCSASQPMTLMEWQKFWDEKWKKNSKFTWMYSPSQRDLSILALAVLVALQCLLTRGSFITIILLL